MKIPFSRIAISLLRISSPSHIQRRSFTSTNLNSLNLTTISRGELGTLEYKLNYEKNGKEISPWHDIPLKNENNYNFITEVFIYFIYFSSSLLLNFLTSLNYLNYLDTSFKYK